MGWKLYKKRKDEEEIGQQQLEPMQQQEEQGHEQDKGWLQQLGGVLASGAGGFAGVPRGLAELLGSAQEQVLGMQARAMPTQEDLQGYSPNIQSLGQIGRQQAEASPIIDIQKTAEYLPTSEQAKEKIGEYLPEGTTKPEGEIEEFLHEFAEDVGSLLFPLPGSSAKFGKKLLDSGLTSGLGNAAKYISKAFNADPETGEKLKIGTMLLTSIGRGDKLKEQSSKLYGELEKEAAGINISSKPIDKIINKIEREYTQRGQRLASSSKEVVQKQLNALKDSKIGDFHAVTDLIKSKKDIYNEIARLYGQQGFAEARKELKGIAKHLNDITKSSKFVPRNVANLSYEADKLYVGMKQADNIKTWINKQVPWLGNILSIPANSVALVKNFANNEPVRRAYTKMVIAATNKNLPVLIKSAKKLTEQLDEKTSSPTQGKWKLYKKMA